MTRFSAMTAVLLVICVAQSAQPQESPAGGDPLKTITYALQLSRQSPGPEHVYAARGAYDNNHGEIFPLEIPRGTSLSSLEGPELTSIEIFSSDISRVPVIVIPLGEQRSVLSGFRIQGGAMGIIAYANDPQESAYRAVIENNIIEKNNYGFNYPAWTPPVMVNDGHVGVAVVAATERVVDVSVRYNRIQDNRFADLLWRARPGNLSTVMGNEISRSRHGIFYEDWETSTEEDGALLIASNVLYCCEVLCYLGGSAQAKLVHNTLAFAQSRPRFHDIAVGLWVGPRNLIAMTGNLFWNPTIDQITGVDVLIPVQTQDALAAFVAQFGRNAYQNGVWRNFVDPRLTNFANGVFPGSVDFVRTNYQTCDLDLHLVGWSAGVRKNSALIDQADAATIVPGGSEETETDVDGDPRISRYYGMDRPDFGADEVSVFSLSFGAGATPSIGGIFGNFPYNGRREGSPVTMDWGVRVDLEAPRPSILGIFAFISRRNGNALADGTNYLLDPAAAPILIGVGPGGTVPLAGDRATIGTTFFMQMLVVAMENGVTRVYLTKRLRIQIHDAR